MTRTHLPATADPPLDSARPERRRLLRPLALAAAGAVAAASVVAAPAALATGDNERETDVYVDVTSEFEVLEVSVETTDLDAVAEDAESGPAQCPDLGSAALPWEAFSYEFESVSGEDVNGEYSKNFRVLFDDAWFAATLTLDEDVALPAGCEYTFSLASFDTDGPTFQTSTEQKHIQTVHGTISDQSRSIDLRVEAPECFGQVDLYVGDAVYDGIERPTPNAFEEIYIEGHMAFWYGGQECTEPPPAEVVAPAATIGGCEDPVVVLDNAESTEPVEFFVDLYESDDLEEFISGASVELGPGESVEIPWTTEPSPEPGNPFQETAVHVETGWYVLVTVGPDDAPEVLADAVVPPCEAATPEPSPSTTTEEPSPTEEPSVTEEPSASEEPSATSSPSATEGVQGSLPRTGAEVGGIVALAVLLLGGGGAAVALTLRSRSQSRHSA